MALRKAAPLMLLAGAATSALARLPAEPMLPPLLLPPAEGLTLRSLPLLPRVGFLLLLLLLPLSGSAFTLLASM
jgi:hypothetical protein